MRVVPMFDENINGLKLPAGIAVTRTLANADALGALVAMYRAYEVPDAFSASSANVEVQVIDLRARRPFQGIALSNGAVAAGAALDTPLAQIVTNRPGNFVLTNDGGGKVKVVGRYIVATGSPIATGETVTISGQIDGVTRSFSLMGIGTAAPPVTLLSLGARIVFAGDSKYSINGSPGQRSIQLQTVDRLAGRVRLAVAGDQGISGNTVAQLRARLQYTIAQKPDIIVVGIGHNSLGDANLIDQLSGIHSDLRAGCPDSQIVWTTILPSATSAGGLYPADNPALVAVNDWIMGLHRTNAGKTHAVNMGYKSTHSPLFNPLAMCYPEGTSPTQYIHPNARGAEFTSAVLAAYADTLIVPQTVAQALADTGAAREHGPNLDPLYMLDGGTSGVKGGTGTAPTGNVATGAAVNNNTTATVACSIEQIGSYYRQIIDISGNVAAEGTVVFNRPNAAPGRVPINGVIGEFFELLTGYQITATDGSSAPTGVLQYGQQLSLSRARYSMGVYGSTDANLGGPITEAKGPRVARTQAGLVRATTGNLSTTADEFGVRLATGAVNVRLILWMPIARRTDLTPYTAPFYMGDDGIQGTSERVGNSANAVALTAGTTYNWQPGLWSGGGITVAQVIETSTDNGATWTLATAAWSWQAAGASGTMVRQTVTATNALGTTTRASAHSIA